MADQNLPREGSRSARFDPNNPVREDYDADYGAIHLRLHALEVAASMPLRKTLPPQRPAAYLPPRDVVDRLDAVLKGPPPESLVWSNGTETFGSVETVIFEGFPMEYAPGVKKLTVNFPGVSDE